MKKYIIAAGIIIALIATFGLVSTSLGSDNETCEENCGTFIDGNSDGICDNWIDSDNDGIKDICGFDTLEGSSCGSCTGDCSSGGCGSSSKSSATCDGEFGESCDGIRKLDGSGRGGLGGGCSGSCDH